MEKLHEESITDEMLYEIDSWLDEIEKRVEMYRSARKAKDCAREVEKYLMRKGGIENMALYSHVDDVLTSIEEETVDFWNFYDYLRDFAEWFNGEAERKRNKRLAAAIDKDIEDVG